MKVIKLQTQVKYGVTRTSDLIQIHSGTGIISSAGKILQEPGPRDLKPRCVSFPGVAR